MVIDLDSILGECGFKLSARHYVSVCVLRVLVNFPGSAMKRCLFGYKKNYFDIHEYQESSKSS